MCRRVARLSSQRAHSVEAFVESARWAHPGDLARAHGLLRRGAWACASLTDLAADASSPFRSSANIQIDGPPVSIVPELAQSMALILHELATNAVKHGALSSRRTSQGVLVAAVTGPALRFVWQESGGPRTTPPAKKGFGLTVLQTAAGDLGAVANCHFQIKDFSTRCRDHSSRSSPRPSCSRSTRPGKQPPTSSSLPVASRILVVEDEALVALQLQNDLRRPAIMLSGRRGPSSMDDVGLARTIDAALLDVSLGRETSAAIADQLLARNIPFAFATGYSDGAHASRAPPQISQAEQALHDQRAPPRR